MKWVFFIFQIFGLLGTIVYAFSGWPIGSAWGIIIARSLNGICAGGLHVMNIDEHDDLTICVSFVWISIVVYIHDSAE